MPKEKNKEKQNNSKLYKVGDTNIISMLPGDPFGSPDESLNFLKDTLVFIDDGFLAKLSRFFGKNKYLKFNKIIFAKNISKKQNLNCEQIFYYTAPPFQSEPPLKNEIERKEKYDKFIKKLKDKGIIIKEGRCQRLKINNNFVYKQKAVDVLITMDLTNVPIKYPDIKKIILIASDSDFVPVIKNLSEQKIKTILYTYYDRKRNTNFSRSNDLIKSVYKYVLLTLKDFENAPLNKKSKN